MAKKLTLLDGSGHITNIIDVDVTMTAENYTILTGIACRDWVEGDTIYIPPTLRQEMIELLSGITDPEKLARLMPMQSSIAYAFDHGVSEEVIKNMILQVDVSDDLDLQALQDAILALPQWTV